MHVGYIVLPKNLAEEFVEMGCYYNQTASKIHQLIIAEFMKSGYFEQHIRKMRTLYAKKHKKIVDSIKKLVLLYIQFPSIIQIKKVQINIMISSLDMGT